MVENAGKIRISLRVNYKTRFLYQWKPLFLQRNCRITFFYLISLFNFAPPFTLWHGFSRIFVLIFFIMRDKSERIWHFEKTPLSSPLSLVNFAQKAFLVIFLRPLDHCKYYSLFIYFLLFSPCNYMNIF